MPMRIPFKGLDQKAWRRLGITALLVFYIVQFGFDAVKNNTLIGLGGDALAFWSVGRIADTRGYGDVYTVDILRQTQNTALEALGFNSELASTMPAPLFAFFFFPFQILSRLDPRPMFWVYSAISLAAIILYLWFFAKKMGSGGGKNISTGMLVMLMLVSYPVFQNLFWGQVEVVLLICAGEFLRNAAGKKPLLAGLWLGGLLIKPQVLILIIPALLLLKNWKVLYGFTISSTVVLGISLGLSGIEGVISMVNLWLSYVPGMATNAPENMMNWRMLALHINGWTNSFVGWIVAGAGILFTLVLDVLLLRRRPQFGSDTWLLVVFGILASTCAVTWHSHTHMAMVLIPFIMFAAMQGILSGRLLNSWVFVTPLVMVLVFIAGAVMVLGVVTFIKGFGGLVMGLCGLTFNTIFTVWAYRRTRQPVNVVSE